MFKNYRMLGLIALAITVIFFVISVLLMNTWNEIFYNSLIMYAIAIVFILNAIVADRSIRKWGQIQITKPDLLLFILVRRGEEEKYPKASLVIAFALFLAGVLLTILDAASLFYSFVLGGLV